MLKDKERERPRRCPNCESRRVRYDEDREVWICLDCDYEWSNNRD